MQELNDAAKLVLVGGAAGSGKSTLAGAWCASRKRAGHIQLDEVRGLVVAGLADPQERGDLQGEQFLLSVRACCSLAREFTGAGYDVTLDDVLYPGPAFDESWRRYLEGVDWRVVVIHPVLDETLRRNASRGREQQVPERLVREQHEAMFDWPERYRVDTSGQTVESSLALLEMRWPEQTRRPYPAFGGHSLLLIRSIR